MKSNPGGQIDLKAVVGRDRLIQRIWEIVEQQSLIITAERRIGKTTVMKKMCAERPKGWVPVYQDLEHCHSAADFAVAVYDEIDQFLSKKGKVARRAKEFLANLEGAEIKGIIKLPQKAGATHWKDMLTQAIEDLTQENDATGSKLLFLWDEVPFMLANIRDREGERTAMEVLDVLRALRQTHPSLRMVITGSIGLHHVLSGLKAKNHGNAPVNDMASIEVRPLEEPDARKLATALLDGEKLHAPDKPATVAAIAHQADRFPFYIHHIVRALKFAEGDATPAAVAAIVAAHMVDANDPWQLLHYRVRIPLYYGPDEEIVLHILDHAATAPDSTSIQETLNALKAASDFDDRNRLIALLTDLDRDHYLLRDPDGGYRFRFPLIQRWWKIHRGL